MTGKTLWVAGGAAALFLLFHVPYLPQSLEDVDSINFALGVRDYDVAHHQPHPPGYPVYIAIAKAIHATGVSEVHTLALMSIVAGALGVVALLLLFSAIEQIGVGSLFSKNEKRLPTPIFATLLAVSAPLYWFTSSRPLTDVVGFAAAVAVQALILSAATDRAIVAASFLAAFATGLRSQVAWLTVPLLVFVIWRRASAGRRRIVLPSFVAFVVGGCTWGVPLLMLTGGPRGYWRAVASQGGEDLSNIVMLYTTHTLREAALSLYYAFVTPWANPWLAATVLVFAAAGVVTVARTRPRALTIAALAFGPYLFFDLVFQESITTRYALPLVAPVAYFAVAGAELAGPAIAIVVIVAGAAFGMHIGGTSVAAYASQPAPAFRLLDGMRDERGSGGTAPVLAMHRREDLDLRRPIAWSGAPAAIGRLPSPPKHEWLELVRYWNGGGRSPVWFVADPLRSDLALIGLRDAPVKYRWTLDYPILLGGTRPSEMDWYVVPPPDWYVGEGWALTPETAGIAKEDRRGPGLGGIEGWIERWASTATLMVGGRNLSSAASPAHVRVALDERLVDEFDVAPGFFVRPIAVPAGALSGPGDYARMTISADSTDLAIEQFDAQPADRVVFGYGEGWHEREYTPSTGKIWRWTSDHGVLRVHSRKQPLVLVVEGEVEAAAKSRVTIRVGDRILAAYDIGESFSLRQVIPQELVKDGDNTITISTDRTYVPAERRSRTLDRRLLGLKVFTCRVTPAS